MVSLQENEIKEDAEAQQKTRGWFGGWFGSGASSVAVSPEAESVVKSLQAEMTPAEIVKLFNAIGYVENAVRDCRVDRRISILLQEAAIQFQVVDFERKDRF